MDFLGAMSDFLTRQGGSLGSASNFGSGNIPLIAADGVTNPLYRVWIQKKVNGQHLTVSTPMPESWSIQLAIPWAQQFASLMQSVAGKVIGSDTAQAVVDMAAASGRQVQNKVLSAQIWGGTANIDVQVPFVFKAENDPQTEVIDPISNLMLMALPSVSNAGMLKAPYAPMVSNMAQKASDISDQYVTANTSEGECSIRFGNYFKLDNCVITQISQSYDTMFDPSGKPLSCKIDLSVTSTYIITRDDMPGILKGTMGDSMQIKDRPAAVQINSGGVAGPNANPSQP